jgi:hypothetical protein
MTSKKNVMAKEGRLKKKEKKKALNAITNKGEKPTSDRLLEGGTAMGKQPLVKMAGARINQSVTKSKRKKMNKKRKGEVASVILKAQGQINTTQEQEQEKTVATATVKAKNTEKGAEAGMKIMS